MRLEKRPDQRRLAHPRLAADDGRARAAARPDLGEQRLQNAQLRLASHEAGRGLAGGGRLGRAPGRARLGEDIEHLRARPARLRIRLEQPVAQRREIERRALRDVAEPGRTPVLLAVQDLVRQPVEGKPPGEQLEQDHAEGVPVGGGGHRAVRHLLGRHVLGRAGSGERRLGRPLADQPEVEQHRPPLGGDEDVRRLDVAVHAPGAVQRDERPRQLGERRAQPLLAIGGADPGVTRPPRAVARLRGGAAVVAARPRPGRHRGQHPRGLRAAHVAAEIDPLDQLHREEPLRPLGDQIAEAHQVGMADVRDRPELALEPEQQVGVDDGQELERHGHRVGLVERLVDDAHPAPTEESHQSKPRGPPERDRPQLHRQARPKRNLTWEPRRRPVGPARGRAAFPPSPAPPARWRSRPARRCGRRPRRRRAGRTPPPAWGSSRPARCRRRSRRAPRRR